MTPINLTLDEWAYELLNNVNPKLKDDEEVNLRQVKSWIIDQRALFLKNKLNTHREIETAITQTLPKLTLEFVTAKDSPIKIFRTVDQIPTVIKTEWGLAIVRIGPTEVYKPSFKFHQSLNAIPFAGNGRFNKYSVFAYMQNDRIYIKTKDPIFPLDENNQIGMSAVFVDPRSLEGFRDDDGRPVYSDAYTSFPMDRDSKAYIEAAIMESKFAITERSVPDEVQDGKDNSDARKAS